VFVTGTAERDYVHVVDRAEAVVGVIRRPVHDVFNIALRDGLAWTLRMQGRWTVTSKASLQHGLRDAVTKDWTAHSAPSRTRRRHVACFL
jgi:hypothetical protein